MAVFILREEIAPIPTKVNFLSISFYLSLRSSRGGGGEGMLLVQGGTISILISIHSQTKNSVKPIMSRSADHPQRHKRKATVRENLLSLLGACQHGNGVTGVAKTAKLL